MDLLHFVVGGCLGLLALRATPSPGSGYQRTLTPPRGALWRRSLCPGWSWGLPIFSWRGRCPCSLFSPCRGAPPSRHLRRVLLDRIRRGYNRGLLLSLLLGGLLGGIFNGNRRLGSLASDVVQINIRCRTSNRRHHAYVKIHKKTSRKKCRKTSCRTYRSKRLCIAAKKLLQVLPVAAAASAPQVVSARCAGQEDHWSPDQHRSVRCQADCAVFGPRTVQLRPLLPRRW